MGRETSISWTHATFNPWRGCTKVSEGCRNCYADSQARRNPGVLGVWGPNGTRVVASEAMWREPVKWDKAAKAAGERRRVFCASMADVFEDWQGPMVSASGEKLNHSGVWQFRGNPAYDPLTMCGVRERLGNLIRDTPNLDWLVLTKRPENVSDMMTDHMFGTHPDGSVAVPPNLWIGTSVENQQAADERIPHLLRVPAAVRFLSCEPLLGPVDMGKHFANNAGYGSDHLFSDRYGYRGRIHWLIVGGESGSGARPMHPDWARSLRDQCQAAGVAFHFKQHGEWGPVERFTDFSDHSTVGRDLTWMYPDGRVERPKTGPDAEAMPRGGTWLAKVGKANAGRLLDGRTWDEFPNPTKE